jgi:hypothetical protein
LSSLTISGTNNSTEGMYSTDEGKGSNQNDREQIFEMINLYIEEVFGTKSEINYDEYLDIIVRKSSDLFFLPMVVLQKKLPCAENI